LAQAEIRRRKAKKQKRADSAPAPAPRNGGLVMGSGYASVPMAPVSPRRHDNVPSLKQQQDVAYNQALLADQLAEEERRRVEQEQKRIKEEQELELYLKQSRQDRIKELLSKRNGDLHLKIWLPNGDSLNYYMNEKENIQESCLQELLTLLWYQFKAEEGDDWTLSSRFNQSYMSCVGDMYIFTRGPAKQVLESCHVLFLKAKIEGDGEQ